MSSLTAESMGAGIQRGALCTCTGPDRVGVHAYQMGRLLAIGACQDNVCHSPPASAWILMQCKYILVQGQLSRDLPDTILSVIRGDSIQHRHRWEKQRKNAHRI